MEFTIIFLATLEMNLLTESELHSFDHKTKKISVVFDDKIDLSKFALIRNTKKNIIIVSFIDLAKYGLDRKIVDYECRNLYIHQSQITGDVHGLLYRLTKSLTEEKITLASLIADEKPCIHEWVSSKVPPVLMDYSEVEKYWKRFCEDTKSEITFAEWNSDFQSVYTEDMFGRMSKTSQYNDYESTIDRCLREKN